MIILGWLISLVLVIATIGIHKKAITIIDKKVLDHKNPQYIVVLGLFFAHLIESLLFAVGYYVSAYYLTIGSLLSESIVSIREYLYFSLVTYTSLGLGDIRPVGELRLIAGTEALIGLLMIGWSASYLFTVSLKK